MATTKFLADGYDAVSLRAIAAEAGVDVALISYFFGSKRGLFGAVLHLTANPTEIIADVLKGDVHTLPQRTLRTAVAVWDDPVLGAPLLTMLRATTSDPALVGLIRGAFEREVIERLATRLGGRDARRRAGAFTSVMAGLIFTRYVVEFEPVKSMSPDEIVRVYAPLLASALGLTAVTGRAPRGRTPVHR